MSYKFKVKRVEAGRYEASFGASTAQIYRSRWEANRWDSSLFRQSFASYSEAKKYTEKAMRTR